MKQATTPETRPVPRESSRGGLKASSSVIYSLDGFSGNLQQWSRRLGIPASTLHSRVAMFGSDESGLRKAFAKTSYRWMRSARFIAYRGETKCIKDWAETFGVKPSLFADRLRRGYSIEEASLTTPRRTKSECGAMKGKFIKLNGIVDNIAGHARRLGIPISTVRVRMKRRHMSAEDALMKPVVSPAEQRQIACTARWSDHRRRQGALVGAII